MPDRRIQDAIHSLLGCQWGRRVALPGDREPCALKAEQIVVLHGHPVDGEFAVKLCAAHRDRVVAETKPHREPVAGGQP